MTPEAVQAIIDAHPLPNGWELRARVVRTFPLRNEYGLLVYHDDVFVKGNRGLYGEQQIRRGVAFYAEWIASQAVAA